MITSNPERTAERYARIVGYLRANVLSDGAFVCASEQLCRASCRANHFYEGQLPHLGRHYDLSINGTERRIVVVGQEYGSPHPRVTVDERTASISGTARYPFGQRNPHMRGTASLLRLLLGREPGADLEGEALPVGQDASVYDGFALVNALMCSAINEISESGFSSKGRASSHMFKNCSRHLRSILDILEPTVIVAQGSSDVAWWLCHALGVERRPGIQSILLNGRPVDLYVFAHPSAGGGYGYWGSSPRTRYLQDVIAPAIRENVRPMAVA